MTTALSDATTVPDAGMLSRFPPWSPATYVPNGVGDPPSRVAFDPSPRIDAEFVVGTLGRVIEEKGIPVSSIPLALEDIVTWMPSPS